MGEVIKQTEAPRLRRMKDIDFSLAKSGCKRCYGRGIIGYNTIDDPEDTTKTLRVPIVCRCVTRHGGVKKDILDKMAEEIQAQLQSGHFSGQLAGDIRRLPKEHQGPAFEMLKRHSQDETKDESVRQALKDAVRILEEGGDVVSGS